MTKVQFFIVAAIIGLMAHDGRAQTAISANQVVCPASQVPVVAVALPSTIAGARPRIVCIPLDPAAFLIDTSGPTPILRFVAPVGPTFVDAEVPTGTIDGSNLVFRLANAPSPASSLQICRNGVRLTAGTDYTLTGQSIAFAQNAQPQTGDTLLADYRR